ncbi:MAG: hypothetical protein OEZ65_15730 [Gemmatimonadota bacterium]|nr:hypothetical protein [Gemmatimonadota bacterium]
MRRLAVGLALTLSFPATGLAQEAHGRATFQAFRFPDPSGLQIHHVQLLTVPFGASVTPLPHTTIELHGGYAAGSALLSNGARVEARGLTDTSIGLTLEGMGFVLNASATLPTGDASPTLEEVALVGVLSSDLLPFEITHWGGGGSAGVDLGYSRTFGRVAAMGSLGYVSARAYAPLEDEVPLYRPGDQKRAKLFVEAAVGEAGLLSVRLGAQRYDQDVYDELNLYRPGVRMEGVVSFASPVGARESIQVYGGIRHRNAGVFDLLPGGFRREDSRNILPGTAESVVSRELMAVGAELFVARQRFQVAPEVQLRVLRSADGIGQGWLTSVGATADWKAWGMRAGRRLMVRPSVRGSAGRVILREGAESNVLGWEAGLSLRIMGGR